MYFLGQLVWKAHIFYDYYTIGNFSYLAVKTIKGQDKLNYYSNVRIYFKSASTVFNATTGIVIYHLNHYSDTIK